MGFSHSFQLILRQAIAGTWTYITRKKNLKETFQWLLTNRCMEVYHSLFMDNLYIQTYVKMIELLLDKKKFTW